MNELAPLLEQLAAQLNVTVGFLWGVMVRQAFISAMGQIVLYVIYIVAFFVWFRIGFSWMKRRFDIDEQYSDNDTAITTVIVVLGIMLIIFSVISLVELPNLFTKLLNPEFWALQQILKYVR